VIAEPVWLKRSWFEYAPEGRNYLQSSWKFLASVFRGLRDGASIPGLDIKEEAVRISAFSPFAGSAKDGVGLPAITTEAEKVKFPGLLIANALAFHALRGYSNCESV
jgi:hypothetical protein